jgi:hypothetical protein
MERAPHRRHSHTARGCSRVGKRTRVSILAYVWLSLYFSPMALSLPSPSTAMMT